MGRASKDLVRAVVTLDDLKWSDDLLTTAASLVNARIPSGVYTEDTLREIETLLTAHFYTLKDSQLARWDTDGAVDQYEPIKVDLGLSVTKFGQQALAFDSFGYLTRRHRRVGITWLGKSGTV